MKTILAALILIAPLASAGTPEPFPSDYVRQSCAPERVCSSVEPYEFHEFAALRGYNLPQEWVLAQWDAMVARMQPVCEKVAHCISVPGNEWVWCKDTLADEFQATCTAYESEYDRDRCRAFAAVFFVASDRQARESQAAAQACTARERANAGERQLDFWIVPSELPLGVEKKLTIHARDRETRIPVMATLTVDHGRFSPTDSLGGAALSGYAQRYTAGLKRVPRADGHRDVAAPVVTIQAAGYRTETLTLPVPESSLIVEMMPKALRRGKNQVTITARDSVTGAPVDARVMGDDRVLGRTNQPFEIEWKKGQPSPEIWVTSLYDLYDDVVVWKKQR